MRASGRQWVLGTVLAGFLLAPHVAPARVLLTQEEALRLAFDDAGVERRTAYLDPDQVAAAAARAGVPVTSGLVPHYVATREGRTVGVAYFDTHVVRTEAETIMVVVNPAGRVVRAEVISFAEPPDYIARDIWLRQFDGQRLDDELAIRRSIRPMTGATLTARAITDAVRRTLALHATIFPDDLAGGRAGDADGEQRESP